jgi:uncharacterized protein YeeX (DUF496 family)
MNSVNVARLTEGMSLGEIHLEMRKLGDFRSPPSQYHTMENGVEVVYVKKYGPKDRLKRLLMSQDMKVNEARPLANLILNACEKIGVDVSDSGYQNIREALINGNGDFHPEMNNLATQELLNKYVRKNGF